MVVDKMILDYRDSNETLKNILSKANPFDVILLADKVYFEQIKVTIPNLKMFGQKHTKICYNASHGTIIPKEAGGDGIRVYGTTGSATFTVTKEATGFTAYQITFENSFDRTGKKDGQAVAFKAECGNVELIDCSFIGFQDTLYMDGGSNNIVMNCTIMGDVDFIFGSADCLFINCNIIARYFNGTAYFLAPDTYEHRKEGFIFKDCTFEAMPEVTAYLGRAWFPSGAKEPVYPRVGLFHCKLKGHIILELLQMHPQDPRRYEVRLEYCSNEAGILQNQVLQQE